MSNPDSHNAPELFDPEEFLVVGPFNAFASLVKNGPLPEKDLITLIRYVEKDFQHNAGKDHFASMIGAMLNTYHEELPSMRLVDALSSFIVKVCCVEIDPKTGEKSFGDDSMTFSIAEFISPEPSDIMKRAVHVSLNKSDVKFIDKHVANQLANAGIFN